MKSYSSTLKGLQTFLTIILAVTMVFQVPSIALAKKPKAKNVIIMISDGAGYNHIDAASYINTGKQEHRFTTFPR